MKTIRVVAAIIVAENKVLAAQRPFGRNHGGFWEFPGGKVERGETDAQALVREIHEELDCRVRVGAFVGSTIHRYSAGVIELVAYRCALAEGTPRAVEHTQIRWLGPDEFGAVEWTPADMALLLPVGADLDDADLKDATA
jgi:8-oxo-dGTP diphosphatase